MFAEFSTVGWSAGWYLPHPVVLSLVLDGGTASEFFLARVAAINYIGAIRRNFSMRELFSVDKTGAWLRGITVQFWIMFSVLRFVVAPRALLVPGYVISSMRPDLHRKIVSGT